MMRALFLFALALLLGAGLVSFISRDSGYVLVSLGQVSIETSLWFAIFSLVALFYLLLVPIRLLLGLKLIWSKRNISQQKKFTRDGFLAFSKGEWTQAVDSLMKADSNAGASFANYLMAARAANEMGNWDRVETILQKALESDPKAKVAIDITRSELLMQNQQWSTATKLLESLKKLAPRHRVVLSLLRTCYIHTSRWEDLRHHIEVLRKSKIFDDAQLNLWEQEALESMLTSAIDNADKSTHPLQHVQRCWSNLSSSSQQNPSVFLQYVQGLSILGGEDQSEALIRRWLKSHWNDRLVLLYGNVRGADIKSQLETAKRWLKTKPNDAGLLLTLGRLSMRNKQWDHAKHYLEDSLAQDESPEAMLELGRLLISMGQIERGKKLLNQGLQEQSGLAALPLP